MPLYSCMLFALFWMNEFTGAHERAISGRKSKGTKLAMLSKREMRNINHTHINQWLKQIIAILYHCDWWILPSMRAQIAVESTDSLPVMPLNQPSIWMGLCPQYLWTLECWWRWQPWPPAGLRSGVLLGWSDRSRHGIQCAVHRLAAMLPPEQAASWRGAGGEPQRSGQHNHTGAEFRDRMKNRD